MARKPFRLWEDDAAEEKAQAEANAATSATASALPSNADQLTESQAGWGAFANAMGAQSGWHTGPKKSIGSAIMDGFNARDSAMAKFRAAAEEKKRYEREATRKDTETAINKQTADFGTKNAQTNADQYSWAVEKYLTHERPLAERQMQINRDLADGTITHQQAQAAHDVVMGKAAMINADAASRAAGTGEVNASTNRMTAANTIATDNQKREILKGQTETTKNLVGSAAKIFTTGTPEDRKNWFVQAASLPPEQAEKMFKVPEVYVKGFTQSPESVTLEGEEKTSPIATTDLIQKTENVKREQDFKRLSDEAPKIVASGNKAAIQDLIIRAGAYGQKGKDVLDAIGITATGFTQPNEAVDATGDTTTSPITQANLDQKVKDLSDQKRFDNLAAAGPKILSSGDKGAINRFIMNMGSFGDKGAKYLEGVGVTAAGFKMPDAAVLPTGTVQTAPAKPSPGALEQKNREDAAVNLLDQMKQLRGAGNKQGVMDLAMQFDAAWPGAKVVDAVTTGNIGFVVKNGDALFDPIFGIQKGGAPNVGPGQTAAPGGGITTDTNAIAAAADAKTLGESKNKLVKTVDAHGREQYVSEASAIHAEASGDPFKASLPPNISSELTEAGKEAAKQVIAVRNSSEAARKMVDNMDEMMVTIQNGGSGASILKKWKSFAGVMGFPVSESLAEADVYESIGLGLSLQGKHLNGGMPGSISNQEETKLEQIMPGLSHSKDGAMMLLEIYKEKALRTIDQHKFTANWIDRNGSIQNKDENTKENYDQALIRFYESHPLQSLNRIERLKRMGK